MATQKIEFSEIQSDVRKVFESNFYHFFALTTFFSYPFVLLLIAFPVLQYLQIINIHIPQQYYPSNQDSISLKDVIFFLLYTLILLTLYTCATATITYSSYHVIFGKRVKFMNAIKSMSKSFIRLFATFFCVLIIIFTGLLAIASIVFGIVKGFEYLGFQTYFVVLNIMLGSKFVLGCGVFYSCGNWFLAPVIVVVEKSWGLEALKRSTYLVKGGRRVVVSLISFFCLYTWVPLSSSWNPTNKDGINIFYIVALMVWSAGSMVYFLYIFTANTVLYMKCKALRGELTKEIEEEYVSLPVDEEEVPLVASADQPKIYEV